MLLRCLRFGMLVLLVSVSLASLLFAGQREKVLIKSRADGSMQPCYVILPDDFDPQGGVVPLLVSLHTWSGNLEQRNSDLEAEANRRGWIYLGPNFRGVNNQPEACGSLKAQQDILDAVDWAKKQYPVDTKRIYLTGVSGGGHMTMLMVGRHPDVWAAASAWVGISDLAAWHKKHADGGYGEMLRKCTGGPPGQSEAIDRQFRLRSPLTHLYRATKTPLDIAAGVHDGHKGSVPVRHSLDAFNAIAKAANGKTVSEEEITQLSRPDGRLDAPQPSDQVEDKALGRKIYLRRMAAASRVTIFEGGHEGIASAAVDWLSRHKKK